MSEITTPYVLPTTNCSPEEMEIIRALSRRKAPLSELAARQICYMIGEGSQGSDVAKPQTGNNMSEERELLAKCKAQFEFYATQHDSKNTVEGDKKARANICFAEEIGELLAKEPPKDVLDVGEQVADYRFARFIKGDNYAYARGLTINPTHLPKALDAMLVDGWKVLSVFGETDSERIGIIFERVATAAETYKLETPPALNAAWDAVGFEKPRGG